MKRLLGISLIATVAATLIFMGWSPDSPLRGEQPAVMKIAAPEFQDLDNWINSKPLTLKDLQGQVVVVNFWTFG